MVKCNDPDIAHLGTWTFISGLQGLEMDEIQQTRNVRYSNTIDGFFPERKSLYIQ